MDGVNRRMDSDRARPTARTARLAGLLRRTGWIAVAMLLALATPAFAQQKPVMENVFYNVVWGSATGALLGSAAAVIAAKDKTNPSGLRSGAFQGATAGGIIGLGVGVWLVFSGITFEPTGSTLTDAGSSAHPFSGGQLAMRVPPPPLIEFETAANNPNRITGFKALVVDLKF